MIHPEGYYRGREITLEQEINSLDKKINSVSFIRLLLGTLVIVAFWYGIKSENKILVYAGLALLIGFFVAVIQHLDLKKKKDLLERRLRVVTNEITALDHRPSFLKDGSDLNDESDFLHRNDYSGDLDVFGPYSLFHRLSRCYTPEGRERLALLLTKPLLDAQEIKERQNAIDELAEKPEFRELFLALMLDKNEEESPANSIGKWLELYAIPKFFRYVVYLRRLLPIVVATGWFFTATTGESRYGLWSSGISLILALLNLKTMNRMHAGLSNTKTSLSAYAAVWLHVSKEKMKVSHNRKLQEDMQEASKALRELAAISDRFDRRLNPLVFILLNSTVAYDFHCMVSMNQWVKKYGNHIRGWFENTAAWEELCSFATWNFNHPEFCIATLHDEKKIIAKNLGHPFIKKENRVDNDIFIGEQEKIILITGSNMSGKSTFLRSIGINQILAQCGARVCAESYGFKPLQILSSLRQSDSLQDNVSLFHAELLRLKSIQKSITEKGFSLVLIDEMLRGTNSEDKLNGSRALILRLMKMDCIGLIATHDLELGDLEQSHQGKISNYCFESVIQFDNLSFDYRLRKGIARNKNASFLLKKMDIIDGNL